METYNAGETVKVHLYVRDLDNNLVDPTEIPEISLLDPLDDLQVTSQDMTLESTGHYYYPVQTLSTWPHGRYITKFHVVDGVLISKHNGSFILGN